MTLIDTNILLRFLLQDHDVLSKKANEIIDKHDAVCLNGVIYEVIHVLQSVYQIERKTIADNLLILFKDDIILGENKAVITRALQVYQETSLDFIDCLLIAYRLIDNHDILSFDKKLINYLKRHDALSF